MAPSRRSRGWSAQSIFTPHASDLHDSAFPTFEKLEDRRLLAATTVQTLPFRLDFGREVGDASDVLDRDGRRTGFTRVQANKLGDEYQPSLIHLDTTNGVLKVTTRGSSTTGGNAGLDNTLVNALETQFDGRGDGITVTARLVGPLSHLNDPFEQSGIYFGADQDNFIKLVAICTPGGQQLQFFDEYLMNTGGTSNTIAENTSRITIGSFTSINTLDLRLTLNASNGRVTASYAVNGGGFQNVPHALTVPSDKRAMLFHAASRAGIIQFHKNNVGPITATYDAFEIASGSSAVGRPQVTDSTPADGATGVHRQLLDGIITNVRLSDVGGIDASSLTPDAVKLVRTSDGRVVPTRAGTSGGGDTITLTLEPGTVLDANTRYTFIVTEGVTDTAGHRFMPYSATFTTSSQTKVYDTSVRFDKAIQNVTVGKQWTSLTFGPDGRLYATDNAGGITRYDVNKTTGALSNALNIHSIRSSNGNQNRLVTGIVFDPASTGANPVAYVSHGQFAFGDTTTDWADDWTGKLTRLSGSNLQTATDVVVGLPRSIRDHLNNQPVFGPDGRLYLPIAGNTAMGAPDAGWGQRPERLLSAAVLQIDVRDITSAVNVRTPDGGGTYDPRATGAKVRIYATGLRNAYDLLWHSNGHLYAPTNGSAAGGAAPEADVFTPGNFTSTDPRVNQFYDDFSNTDGNPATDYGKFRIDQSFNGSFNGPRGPGVLRVGVKQRDFMFRIDPNGYYGHPNPLRDEWVLNGGNPTSGVDAAEVTAYPVGTQPDRNFRGFAYDFGESKSPNGVIEYRGDAFGGVLNGKILVTRFNTNNDILVMTPNAQGNIVATKDNYFGLDGFVNPLDLTQDPTTGFLYVAEYDRDAASNASNARITLLRPATTTGVRGTIAVGNPQLYFNDIADGSTNASPVRRLAVTNVGTGTLTIPAGGLRVTGTDATQFRVRNLSTLPASIAPGATHFVDIDFLAASKGVKSATLEITSDDVANPLTRVTLRGLGTLGEGGTNEPSLQRILDLYQIPVNVGDPDPETVAMPATKIANSDEVDIERLVKAGSGPVTIDVLGIFGVKTKPTVVDFGWYKPGTRSALSPLFSVPNTTSQSVNPTINGVLAFDPGSASFGLYGTFPHFRDNKLNAADPGQPRTVYSEEHLNTWELKANERRKVKFYPLKNPDGTVVPNAFVFAFEEYYHATDTNRTDQNDVVGIIRNVRVTAAGPQIGLENPDREVPGPTRLVMSRVRDLDPDRMKGDGTFEAAYPNYVYDEATLLVRNTGNAPLTIGRPIVSNGDFVLTSGGSGGTVNPGGTLTVKVKFVYNDSSAKGYRHRTATLSIPSNDPNTPTTTVALAGLWQSHSEFDENKRQVEPDLRPLVEAYGYKVVTGGGSTGDNVNTNARVEKVGQENLSSYWRQSDTSRPVEVIQIAAYHGQDVGKGTIFRWFEQGFVPAAGNRGSEVFRHGDRYGQSVAPRINNTSTAIAAGRFEPNGKAFGVSVDGWTSDAALNSAERTSDAGHALRWYALRDAVGTLIPDTYLIAHDYTGSPGVTNYDYQDNIYVIRNVRPTTAPTAVAGAAISTSSAGNRLAWTANTEGHVVGYQISRRLGETGDFTLLTTVTGTNFTDANAPVGVRAYYRVAAVDQHGLASAPVTRDITRTSGSVTPTVPNAPGNLSAVVTSATQVNLSWSDNSSDETGFRVQRRVGSGSYVTLATVAGNVTSYVDATATASTTYTYRVFATNAAGDSVGSNESTVTTPAAPTQPPPTTGESAFVQNPTSGLVSIEAWARDHATVGSNGQAWQPFTGLPGHSGPNALVSGPDLGTNHKTAAEAIAGSPRLDYKVQFDRPGLHYVWVRVNAPDGNADSIHLGLNGTVTAENYSFRATSGWIWTETVSGGARAVVNVPTAGVHTLNVWMREDGARLDKIVLSPSDTYNPGTGTGPVMSDRTTPPPTQTAPAAPTNLAAVLDGSAVSLTWTDASSNETGFRVQRKTGTGGTWSTLATLPTDATTYRDTTVASGTTYVYRVFATNAVGDSPASNETTVTTPAAPSPTGVFRQANGMLSVVSTNFHARQAGAAGAVWQLISDSRAIGGQAIQALPNTGAQFEAAEAITQSPRVDFQVEFTRAGTHHVWVRGFAATGSDDSVHVGLNGVIADSAARLTSVPRDGYGWTNKTMSGPTATLNVPTAGVYTLSVWMREDGVVLDKVVVTTDAAFTPTGTGPAESERVSNQPPPTAPAAPQLTSARGTGPREATLAWADNSTDETGFQVERRLDGSTTFTRVATLNANVTSYVDTTVSPNTAYVYRVRAINVVDGQTLASDWSNENRATTPEEPVQTVAYLQDASTGLVVVNAIGFDNKTVGNNGQEWQPFTGLAGHSGTAAMTSGPDLGTNHKTAAEAVAHSPRLDYSVYFDRVGTHYLWVRVNAPDGNADSIHVGLNGAVTAENYSFRSSTTWGWTNTVSGGGIAVVNVPSVGVHTLNVWMREDAARLDRILLTPSPTYSPSGSGPTQSPRGTAPGSTPAPTAPAAPSDLAASSTSAAVTLTWADNASDETGFEVFRRVGESGSFQRIATPGANATTFTDTAVTAGTAYAYRVRAINGVGASADSNTVTTFVPAAGPTLTSADIGNPTPGSTVVNTPGVSYNVTASGADVWRDADQFRFVHTTVSGDFTWTVRVSGIDNPADAWSMAGLMARDGTAANARNVYMKVTAGNGHRLSYRTSTGGSTVAVGTGTPTFPTAWLRLVRVGNTFIGLESSDGSTWREVGRTSISLPSTLLVGLATSSHDNGTLSTAQYRNLTIA